MPSTASEQSLAYAERFSGDALVTKSCMVPQSCVHGVCTRPGATALNLIGPYDLASSTVMWFSAALVIAYAIELPIGRTPAIEVMVTTLPSSLFRRCGIAALVSHHVPYTFTLNVLSKMSSVSPSRSPCGTSVVHPALLTRMSSRPNVFNVSSMRCWPCALSLMSACT